MIVRSLPTASGANAETHTRKLIPTVRDRDGANSHSRLWYQASDAEERVDHVVLPHKDGHKDVRNRNLRQVQGIAASYTSRDEDGHIRDEDNPEQSAIEREYLESDVPEEVSLRLLGEVIVEVTLPRDLALLDLYGDFALAVMQRRYGCRGAWRKART